MTNMDPPVGVFEDDLLVSPKISDSGDFCMLDGWSLVDQMRPAGITQQRQATCLNVFEL